MTTTNTANPQVRAACYCRISSDPNDKREGVDRQRQDTAALCEVKGWTIAGVYIDNDRSASNGKARPEWTRLLADVEAGKIDAVAAWDQDRVNRTMDDFMAYKPVFVSRGLLLATSNNGDIDLSTPAGELMATIKTAVSTHEIAMMKVRMRRAGRAKAERGAPKWSRAFGYAEGLDGPELDPATAPLVAQAYAALLSGASLGDICRLFNGAGAHGLNGKPWTASTVSLFLRAPRNAGLRAYGGQIVGKATWPPLVDESTWREAQAILDAPHRKPGRKSVQKHLLTGVMACRKCGHYLSGHQTPSKAIAYVCKGCRGVSVRAENVEPMLYKVVSGRLAMADAVDLLKAEEHDAAEAERIRRELAVLYARLESIGVDYAEGLLTGQQAKAATEVVNGKIAKLEAEQHDSERLRVFDGLPLGTPEVVEAVKGLTADRFRAVLGVLATVTVAPVGKGSHVFNPERVSIDWRS